MHMYSVDALVNIHVIYRSRENLKEEARRQMEEREKIMHGFVPAHPLRYIASLYM